MDPEYKPHATSVLVPTLVLVVIAVVALASALLSTGREAPVVSPARHATAPAATADVVRAPPLNSMGAGPGCQTCGVIESVAPVSGGKGFQMRIRMDDGRLRTIEDRGAMPAGTRVLVEGDSVRLMPGQG